MDDTKISARNILMGKGHYPSKQETRVQFLKQGYAAEIRFTLDLPGRSPRLGAPLGPTCQLNLCYPCEVR